MEDGVIQLRFRKLEQNGKIILHSVMSLGLIDALAGVPAFGPNITNEEAAAMGLNLPAILTYQRPLIKERIEGLQFAWKAERFMHTGTITLHVPPEHINEGRIEAVHDGDEVVLTLKMRELLPAFGEEHYDVNTERAKTIGPSTSSTANTGLQRVNSMRTCSTFPSSSTSCPSGLRTAKRRNCSPTSTSALSPRELHQLFQRYTCWMPHRDAKLDYGNPADVEGARALTRSANRKAYRLALEMAIQGASPLSGRIQVMELPGAGLARAP